MSLQTPPSSKPPKSAMKTSGGRKRKSRKKRGGVTIYDLGRNFNNNDFKVGQKIDMKMTATSDPLTNLIILEVDDEEINIYYSSTSRIIYPGKITSDIYSVRYHSVRYPEMPKRPKSATKTGKRDDGGGNNFDTMGLGRLFSQSGGKRTRKKRGGGGYEERLFFTTMAGDEFSIALMPPEDDDADTKEDTNEDTQQLDDDSEIARWMTFEQIQKVLLEYLEDLNREAAERGDGGKYTINQHTNIHLVLPNRQVAALGSTEWRRQQRERQVDEWTRAPHYWHELDEVLDEAWVDKRILTSRLDPEDPEKRVPYYSELQPGRLIHIFLSHTPGEGAPSRDLEARARRRLELLAEDASFEGAVWGGEEGWVGGGRRKTKRKRGGVGVWVTVVELKRNFNINDFEVGLIIDMKMSASEHPRTNLEIVMLEDEELIYKFKSEDNPTSRGARFRNIHAVKFPHEYAVEKGFLKKKPPKSATKTSKKRGGRRKTRRKRGGAPHGNFIVGAKVQLTEAGLDYYTTAVEHARYLFGGREQPPDRETAATWRGRINDSQASGWDSDNEDSKGYVQVQWEEQTISWPSGTGRMIGYGVERPDNALPHLYPPIDYIKLARRKPPKSAMKKHTAKKKKHTTHPPINYAKKGIYLPLTLVGGKRRKTRRRKTRRLENCIGDVDTNLETTV